MRGRIKKLERKVRQAEPDVDVIRYWFEGEDGDTDGEFNMACIDWGQFNTLVLTNQPGETNDEFCARAASYRAKSWDEAQDEIDLPHSAASYQNRNKSV